MESVPKEIVVRESLNVSYPLEPPAAPRPVGRREVSTSGASDANPSDANPSGATSVYLGCRR